MTKEIVKTEPVTPNTLLALAVEGGADADKLEKLMALQERWEATQAKKAYVEAMANFRSQCPAIDKTKTGHNNKYAGLCETLEQIKCLLSECGLSHSWKTNQDNGMITVECVVTHISGHSESTKLTASPDTTGNKNPIQAIGSTVSYLERYTLYALLGLASKEMDDDGNESGKSKPEPENDPEKLVLDEYDRFCEEHFGELPNDKDWSIDKWKEAIRKRYKQTKAAVKDLPPFDAAFAASLAANVEVEEVIE